MPDRFGLTSAAGPDNQSEIVRKGRAMSDMEDRKPRLVVPRRWMIAGSVATVGALAAAPGFAQSSEGGEAWTPTSST
jgi:hypothetical protein